MKSEMDDLLGTATTTTTTTTTATTLEHLLGSSIVLDRCRNPVPVYSIAESGKVVGLYFCSSSCPCCLRFTPKLAEFYQRMKDKVEVIFISKDNDVEGEEDWAEHVVSMPWLALPYHNKDTESILSDKYGVHGIPRLILLDSTTGVMINKNARYLVEEYKTGSGFPWKEKH